MMMMFVFSDKNSIIPIGAQFKIYEGCNFDALLCHVTIVAALPYGPLNVILRMIVRCVLVRIYTTKLLRG